MQLPVLDSMSKFQLKDRKWDEEEEGHSQGHGRGQTIYAHVEFVATIILIT